MNFSERLKYAVRVLSGSKSLELPQHGVGGSVSSTSFFEVWNNGKVSNSYRVKKGNYDDAYRKNALVFSCVNAIVLSTTEAPLKDYDAEDSEKRNSPVRALIEHPNDEQGETDFMTSILIYGALGGNCAVHKLRNSKGVITGLVPYPINRMRPVCVKGSSNWIEYYEYVVDGYVERKISRDDVILMKWWGQDPRRPWLGQPPLLAAADDVDTDEALTEFIKAVLENGAVVPTVFTTDKDAKIGEARLKQLKQDVQDGFTGSNRGKAMFLEGGITATKLGLDLKELSVDKLRNVPESRICSAFRTPPIIAYANMGLENATYSNLDGFKRSFTQDTISPLWVRLASALAHGLRDEFPKEKIALKFDTSRIAALQENQNEVETRAIASYTAGIRTKNETRALLKLKEVASGDVFADGSDVNGNEPEVPATEPAASEVVTSTSKRKTFFDYKGIMKSDGFTEELAEAHFKAYDDDAQAGADAIADAVSKAFTELEKQLLKVLPDAKSLSVKELVVDGIFDFWDDEYFEAILSDYAIEPVTNLTVSMMSKAAANIGERWSEIESSFDKQIKRVVSRSTAKITETDATAKAELQELLAKISQETPEKIRAAVKEKFATYKDSKARAIAQTTSTFATGAAQTEVWDEFGFESEWLTQRDGKARKSHVDADGTKRNQDGDFIVGNDKMKHPAAGSIAKENVNCRCTLIPVAIEEGKRWGLMYDGKEVKACLM